MLSYSYISIYKYIINSYLHHNTSQIFGQFQNSNFTQSTLTTDGKQLNLHLNVRTSKAYCIQQLAANRSLEWVASAGHPF